MAPPRQGLATTDNFRFVRYWWEVEPTHRQSPIRATPGKWLPYAKSGQFRRWYEQTRHRVNWLDDGREIKQAIVDRYPYLNGKWGWVAKNSGFYGRAGITWSYLTSGRFSARRLEPGAIFDVAGSSLFPDNIPGMMAILNSSAVHRLLGAINPTVNFQVGDLAELPVPAEIPRELEQLAESAMQIQMELDSHDETAPDFVMPLPWDDAADRQRAAEINLRTIEQEIDVVVCGLYGLDPEPCELDGEIAYDRIDLARRWASHAVGLLLGRSGGSEPGRVLRIDPPDPRIVGELREILCRCAGEKAALEIESEVGGIGRFLAGDFNAWHVSLYRNRPPFWALRAGGAVYLLAHDAATRCALSPLLRIEGVSLPDGWDRTTDDGIQTRLWALGAMVADAGSRKVLQKLKPVIPAMAASVP